MGIREFLDTKPWVGWAVAGVFMLIAVWFAWRATFAGGDAYSVDRMREFVTIKYADTGKEEQVPRGRLIKMLLDQGGVIDATKGILNPETNQHTGFIYDKVEWEALVKQLNDDRAAGEAARGRAPAGK